MDHSAVAELVDAVHVALGLRLSAVVLFAAQSLEPGGADAAVELLAVSEDLPSDLAERATYLEQRAPPGSFAGATISLQTPAEFAANDNSVYQRIAGEGRIMLDLDGLVSRQLARLS